MGVTVLPPGTPPPDTLPFGALPSGFPVDGSSKKTVEEVLPLFRSKNIKFSSPVGKSADSGSISKAPELDGIDDDLKKYLTSAAILSVLGDLEKILAESMTESNEKQVALAKERIKVLKDQILKTKDERLEKVSESMKEMEKASKMNIFTKVFGWLMTVLTVVLAIAASIASGGAAVGPILAAVTAVAFQVLGETGVTDKIVEKLTEELKKGMSKQAAQILSQVIVAVVQIALTVSVGMVGGMIEAAIKEGGKALTQLAASALKELIKSTAEDITLACKGLLAGGGLMMLFVGGCTAFQQYRSGNEQAKLKELESFIARLQQWLDETDEELQKIVEQLQSLVSEILELVTNPVETSYEISKNLV